jgi:hypothetical protein
VGLSVAVGELAGEGVNVGREGSGVLDGTAADVGGVPVADGVSVAGTVRATKGQLQARRSIPASAMSTFLRFFMLAIISFCPLGS